MSEHEVIDIDCTTGEPILKHGDTVGVVAMVNPSGEPVPIVYEGLVTFSGEVRFEQPPIGWSNADFVGGIVVGALCMIFTITILFAYGKGKNDGAV